MKITSLKNGIIVNLNKILEANNIRCRITDDNFDEQNNNVPATVTEINILYVQSTWQKILSSPYSKPSYNRTVTFNIRLCVKNIRDEDQAQDFNDLIIQGLSQYPLFNKWLTITTDEFTEFVEGFWVYQQSWEYVLAGIDNSCTDDEYGTLTGIQVFVSPNHNSPVVYNEDLGVEI